MTNDTKVTLNGILVAKLCDEGYDNRFLRDTQKLTKGSMIVVRYRKYSTLDVEHVKINKDVHVVESVEKFHKMLRHVSEKDMHG